MEYFKTPIRRKAYEFHSQIRTESLSKMKTTVRAVNDLTAKKQSQNDQFNKLCQKLATNCNNDEAIQEIKKMYKQQGFIIKQSNGRKINLALKQFLRMSELKNLEDRKKDEKNIEIEVGCYIAKEKKQSIVRNFYQFLVLLARNAYRYPQQGCFDNPDILNTFMEILKTTNYESIRSQILMLIILISQNIATKKYFLSNNIISILVNQRFQKTHKFIQNLLTDIFNIRAFKLTKQNVDQLMRLFDVHKQMIFTSLDEDSINEMNFFIKCMSQQLTNEVKNYGKFNEMMFFLLNKCLEINFNQSKNYELLYAKVLDTIISLMGSNYILTEDNKTCLSEHLQTFWKINTQKVKQYRQLIEQIFENGTNQNLENNLSSLKENCQIIINSFMNFFQFTYQTFPQGQKIKIYAQQLLYHFYQQFKKGTQKGKLTYGQLRFLIKNNFDFKQNDFQIMTKWYEYSLQNKECRIQCPKKLSGATINGLMTLQEFGKLSAIYEEKRMNFTQKFDQLTDFILNNKSIPSNYDIARKQQEINRRKQETEQKQIKNNQTQTRDIMQDYINQGYNLRQLECIRKLL